MPTGAAGGRGPAAPAPEKSPGVLSALAELLRETTAGDPIPGLKWTHRSLRRIRRALRRRGIKRAPATSARRLRRRKFSLRTNRKRRAGIQDPRRDEQVRSPVRLRRWHITRGLPVISAGTTKEWVGNFKNPGRCGRRDDRDVLGHDSPSWAVPVAAYDLARHDGYAVIGTAHDAPAVTVAPIRRWWSEVGRRRHPPVRRLLIEVESGGATASRKWGWKVGLQPPAGEGGVSITVAHSPSGASKWNPIEHRMFSPISANRAGEPLVSYETIPRCIRTTRTDTGSHCWARLDRKDSPPEQRATRAEEAWVRLKRRPVQPSGTTRSTRIATVRKGDVILLTVTDFVEAPSAAVTRH